MPRRTPIPLTTATSRYMKTGTASGVTGGRRLRLRLAAT